MIVLGIETSCDETAAAVVSHVSQEKQILSNVLSSQIRHHEAFGGIVPEVAARAHLDYLEPVLTLAMKEAALSFTELDGIAVTCGPGLIGGVMVGVMGAKTLAAYYEIPFLAVNHLAAHALTPRLTHTIEFPYLVLLISGGHTQLLIVRSPFDFELLGTTLDDAVGEAFDKTGRLLGLSYPGGPKIEHLARQGREDIYDLPRPLLSKKDPALRCSFSLSGLKTALKRHVDKLSPLTAHHKADLAAAFQGCVRDILASRLNHALDYCHEKGIQLQGIVLAGGVAANLEIRKQLTAVTEQHGMILVAPPVNLCTDNAAMVAWAGLEKLRRGKTDDLGFLPRPRWPLQELTL